MPRPLTRLEARRLIEAEKLDEIIKKQDRERYLQKAQAREIGKPLDDYRGPPVVDRIMSVRAHIRDMTPDELMQLAFEIRHGLRLRMVNDEVLAALFRAWAAQVPGQLASPSRSDQGAWATRRAAAVAETTRQLADAHLEYTLRSEPSPAATSATPLPGGRGEALQGYRKSPAASDK